MYMLCVLNTYVHVVCVLNTYVHVVCVLNTYVHVVCVLNTYVHVVCVLNTYVHVVCVLNTYLHVVCVLNTYLHVVCVLTIHPSLQSGHTAIGAARSQGHMEVVRLLQQSQRAAAVETGRKVRIHGNCSRKIGLGINLSIY